MASTFALTLIISLGFGCGDASRMDAEQVSSVVTQLSSYNEILMEQVSTLKQQLKESQRRVAKMEATKQQKAEEAVVLYGISEDGTYGRKPNAGAVCCQRRGDQNNNGHVVNNNGGRRCCSADQVSRRDIGRCSTSLRSVTKGGCQRGDKEVQFWHVVWQFNRDGSSASCTDLTAKGKGNWWGTWGFGSTTYCEDPVKVATDTQMYLLQSPIELTHSPPVAGRCCFCEDDCKIWCKTSHYRSRGDCTSFCRSRGGLHSADLVPKHSSGSHRAECH